MSNPLRILLVDDHTLFRSGIRLLLQRNADFEVVGEAADGLDGVKRARELAPDIVLLDLNMPGLSGLEALQLIRQDRPGCHVVLLTVSEESDDLMAALQGGADGYLLKNIDADFLLDSLRRVANGDSVISAEMTRKLISHCRTGGTPTPPPQTEADRLTPREREILVQVAAGLSNKEIGRKLDVAESTVKIHVQSILRKLELSSRVQAAIYAVEHGLAGGQS
ncbi:response regulator [Parachitinimonas caeni]|uniref:Response regulator transcription factor n=1 Tax=Parachitinimonas caeni TaxID=3031301 RepID=A0ABT7E049_9NEIS|nr:response regulator transcription factor [Parachitinimonas caeni]MDK2125686.1 response regulator transcription factor [Parachitinimonas caeni]